MPILSKCGVFRYIGAGSVRRRATSHCVQPLFIPPSKAIPPKDIHEDP